VESRPSLRDNADFYSWYEAGAGFEKPSLIISMKNDCAFLPCSRRRCLLFPLTAPPPFLFLAKKTQVQDGEGTALARSKNRCAYLAVSLVDGTGVDSVFLSLARLMLGDANVTVSGWKSV
jgi:hypothetical protein